MKWRGYWDDKECVIEADDIYWAKKKVAAHFDAQARLDEEGMKALKRFGMSGKVLPENVSVKPFFEG